MLHPPIRPYSVKNTAKANDRAVLSRVQLNEVINIGKFQDLTGQRFGKLEVIERAENKNGKVMWLCKCDCGNYHTTITNRLKAGLCISCGCSNPFKNPLVNPAKRKFNTYDLSGKYGVGYTSKGEEFYFDLEDYDKIKEYCWYINGDGYVVTHTHNSNKMMYMHRFILKDFNKDNLIVDHIFHKKEDNRKSQLRLVSYQQNASNSTPRKDNTSGYKGVYWHSPSSKWEVLIQYKNKLVNLGLYTDISDAIRVRKEAEIKYFGDYRYQENSDSI